MASALTGASSLLFTKTAPAVNGAISPDGRWLAYQAAEGSATEEIHVRPFPDVESGHWQVSAGGGSKPSWTRGGRELVFLGVPADSFTRRYLSASVPLLRPGDAFSHGAPVVLFESAGHRMAGHPGRTYDVMPDGSRFLIIKGRPDAGEPVPSLTIVTHWFDLIRARLSNR